MAEPARKLSFTYADYVVWEEQNQEKHQYCQGEVFAMAGGSPEHAFLAAAVVRQLGNLLQGRPCVVFTSDLRVRVEDDDLATYPDAVVVCDRLQHHPEDKQAITNPSLIVEILSPTTEGYDRGGKFSSYQKLASLTDYILVSQGRNQIEHFHRNPDGSWTYRSHGPGGALDVLGGQLSLDAVYEKVELVRSLPADVPAVP